VSKGLGIYDPATGARLRYTELTNRVVDLVVSDDGSRIFTMQYPYSGSGTWITAYDGDSLEEVGTVALPGWCPSGHIALAGARVWVGCNTDNLGFGSVPADLSGPWEELALPVAHTIDSPALASVGDAEPVLLVGGNVAGLGGKDAVLRLALDGGQAEVEAEVVLPYRWEDEVFRLLVSPDHQLVVAGTAVRDAQTLEEVQRFPLERYDGIHAWHADSTHLLGYVRDSSYRYEAALWSLGHPSPTSGAAFPVAFGVGYEGGPMASSPEGDRVYVLEPTNVVTTVHLGPEPAHLLLEPPGTLGPSVVSGWLSLPDGTPLLAQPVTVERVGPLGAVPVGVALAAADGSFRVVDPLGPPTPATTYRARWLGDVQHPLGAIALRLATTPPTPAPTAGLGLDLAVPMRALYPHEIVVDELHGRVLVLGNVTSPGSYEDLQLGARVDLYSLAGVPAGSLALADEPTDILLTSDGTHLLVTLPKLGRVDVLDAATLLRVGTITTAPLMRMPRVAQVVGDELWIQDLGATHPRIAPLAAPMDAQKVQLGWWDAKASVIPDPARPTQPLQGGGAGSYELYRWDATTSPPTIVESALLDPRPNNKVLVVPQVEGPLFEVWTHGIRALDRDTFATVAERRDPERSTTWQGEWVTRAAPGPDADQVIAVVSGPDAAGAADTEVVVWDEGAAPYRRYDLGDEYPRLVGTSRSGAVAAVVSQTEGQSAAFTPPPTVLRILRDPFGNGPTRPFVDLAHLVDRHLLDLLGVSVPQATSWFVDQLEQGAFSTGDMAAWLLAMSDPTRGAISRLYLAARGRFPTPSELTARERELHAGRSLSSVATTVAGSLSKGRTALATSQTKAYVAGVAPYVEADLAYLGMLGRNATWAEITTWIVARTGGRTTGQLFDDIRTGAEYAGRVGGPATA
jgi:hypothetical protein